jgi:hypothetical protein
MKINNDNPRDVAKLERNHTQYFGKRMVATAMLNGLSDEMMQGSTTTFPRIIIFKLQIKNTELCIRKGFKNLPPTIQK